MGMGIHERRVIALRGSGVRALALTVIVLALAAPFPAAAPGRCSRFALEGVSPGMAASQVRKTLASRPGLAPARAAFRSATTAIYEGRGITLAIDYDRASSEKPEPKVVQVELRRPLGSIDAVEYARWLLESFGDPDAGRSSLGDGLQAEPARWTDMSCGVEATASRSEAPWWQPTAAEWRVRIAAKRFVGVAAKVEPEAMTERAAAPAVEPAPAPPPVSEHAVPGPTPAEPATRRDADTGAVSPEAPQPRGGLVEGTPGVATESSDDSATLVPFETEPVRDPAASPAPVYPRLAQRTKSEGRVLVRAFVRADGSVSDVTVLQCTRAGLGFERAATDAVKRWRFRPAMRGGQRIEGKSEFWIKFEMAGSRR